MRISETLNNLGVLAFMCGDHDASLKHFKETLKVQSMLLNNCLYGGQNLLVHGITLNISVVRANIGFIKLVCKDLPAATMAFESALMVSARILHNVMCDFSI
jgi:hypothetical protein